MERIIINDLHIQNMTLTFLCTNAIQNLILSFFFKPTVLQKILNLGKNYTFLPFKSKVDQMNKDLFFMYLQMCRAPSTEHMITIVSQQPDSRCVMMKRWWRRAGVTWHPTTVWYVCCTARVQRVKMITPRAQDGNSL